VKSSSDAEFDAHLVGRDGDEKNRVSMQIAVVDEDDVTGEHNHSNSSDFHGMTDGRQQETEKEASEGDETAVTCGSC
jgi:hypothetical protein